MYSFSTAALELPLNDLVEIKNLFRLDLDLVSHPNPKLVSGCKETGTQIYIIDGTIYGCFVNKIIEVDKEYYKWAWFGFHYNQNDQTLVPDSYINFQDLLDFCDENLVENLLYHLDILTDN